MRTTLTNICKFSWPPTTCVQWWDCSIITVLFWHNRHLSSRLIITTDNCFWFYSRTLIIVKTGLRWLDMMYVFPLPLLLSPSSSPSLHPLRLSNLRQITKIHFPHSLHGLNGLLTFRNVRCKSTPTCLNTAFPCARVSLEESDCLGNLLSLPLATCNVAVFVAKLWLHSASFSHYKLWRKQNI